MEQLTFSINQSAPSCSVPTLADYQAQKKIQVVSTSQLNFGNEISQSNHESKSQASVLFYELRLKAALLQGKSQDALEASTAEAPCYFPGPIIPGPGGVHCHEVNRGNMLFDQFKNLLSFDGKTSKRVATVAGQLQCEKVELKIAAAPVNEVWAWTHIQAPQLSFLHQIVKEECTKPDAAEQTAALNILATEAERLFAAAQEQNFKAGVDALLNLVRRAWHQSVSTESVKPEQSAIAQAAKFLKQNQSAINPGNLLYILFELDAMIGYQTISAGLQTFASGVFAGNFVEVALYPLVKLGATEFCVRERLFDEVINLVGRGFAPVVINEMGLVADGNHRVTASWIWNILKYTAEQNLDWSLDDEEFQKAAANFFADSKESAVSRHEALSHLAHFLSRPEYRSKLNTYIRPLLAGYDYIKELPVVFLPEYLSQAVVKSHYDDGSKIERACPSVYETLAMNDSLVLPPRASYHFTDSALLPWFTVLAPQQSQTRFRHGGKRLSARTIPTGCRDQKRKYVHKNLKAVTLNMEAQEKNQ